MLCRSKLTRVYGVSNSGLRTWSRFWTFSWKALLLMLVWNAYLAQIAKKEHPEVTEVPTITRPTHLSCRWRYPLQAHASLPTSKPISLNRKKDLGSNGRVTLLFGFIMQVKQREYAAVCIKNMHEQRQTAKTANSQALPEGSVGLFCLQ